MRRTAIILSTLLLTVPGATPAYQSKDDGGKYLLLATTKTSTMEKELNEAADRGFRILSGSPTAGTEMAIFLQRVASPPNTYKYKLLATSRTGTMQKELNEAAAGGYRLMPSTMISKKSMMGGVEIVAVMELSPSSGKRYDYRLLATSKTGTLQKEALEAQEAGYVLVGMVSRGEHMVIMEKETAGR